MSSFKHMLMHWHLSIWMWFAESHMYFCKIENFAYEEINERSFINPHLNPQVVVVLMFCTKWKNWKVQHKDVPCQYNDAIWASIPQRLQIAQLCDSSVRSHYLNQCWLRISEVPWASPKGSFLQEMLKRSTIYMIWKLLIQDYSHISQRLMSSGTYY